MRIPSLRTVCETATVGVLALALWRLGEVAEIRDALAKLVLSQRETINGYETEPDPPVFTFKIIPTVPDIKYVGRRDACEAFIKSYPEQAYNLAVGMLGEPLESCWGWRKTRGGLFLEAGAIKQNVSSFNARNAGEFYRGFVRVTREELSASELESLTHAQGHLDDAVEQTVRAYLLGGRMPVPVGVKSGTHI